MHLFGLVAGDTAHVALDSVNIALSSPADVLIAHATAVTGGTLIERVGTGFEKVPVDKTLAHRGGATDMASAATGMAFAAVTFQAHLDGLVFIRLGAALQDGCKRPQGRVQRIFGRGDNLLMTFAAGAFRIDEGRIRLQALVRGSFIRCFGIAAMANFAGDLTVITV